MSMMTTSLNSPLAWRSWSLPACSPKEIASKRLKNLEKVWLSSSVAFHLCHLVRTESACSSSTRNSCLDLRPSSQKFVIVCFRLTSRTLHGDFSILLTRVEKGIFNCCQEIKKLLRTCSPPSSSSSELSFPN